MLFEAGRAAANGLSFQQALGTITIEAAKILGIEERVGSLQVGKDGDLALYDGDPFEYTTHCVGVVIDGRVVSKLVHEIDTRHLETAQKQRPQFSHPLERGFGEGHREYRSY